MTLEFLLFVGSLSLTFLDSELCSWFYYSLYCVVLTSDAILLNISNYSLLNWFRYVLGLNCLLYFSLCKVRVYGSVIYFLKIKLINEETERMYLLYFLNLIFLKMLDNVRLWSTLIVAWIWDICFKLFCCSTISQFGFKLTQHCGTYIKVSLSYKESTVM